MAPPTSLLLARFMRLPRVAGATWQGKIARLPVWADGPDGRPVRPRAAVWVTSTTGRINLEQIDEGPGARDPVEVAVTAMLDFGLDRHKRGACRPARVEVDDAELAERIRVVIPGSELTVAVVDALPLLHGVFNALAQDVMGEPLPPGPLDAPGVTLERLRAFAGAAKAFAAASPWRTLTDEDLIRVEAPAGPPALRHLVVMGSAGQIRDGPRRDAGPGGQGVPARQPGRGDRLRGGDLRRLGRHGGRAGVAREGNAPRQGGAPAREDAMT